MRPSQKVVGAKVHHKDSLMIMEIIEVIEGDRFAVCRDDNKNEYIFELDELMLV